jgi:outer membrane receptor for ferrienterochelin and colicins
MKLMKAFFTILTFLSFGLMVQAQTGTITGKVTDESGEAMVGASVVVESTSEGAFTDLDGNYSLEVSPGTYTIIATYIGYSEAREEATVSAGGTVSLNFTLKEGTLLDVVVVSGSKRPEKLTESPATIETVFAREIEEYAGNPGELIARQKGVDYFRAGLAVTGFNVRGFNSNFNSKNLQVTDGRLSTLVATGLPFGPLNTTIKEDIERYEIILGPNATLYGPNAHNGLLNTITKDPRRYQGTTLASNIGVTGSGDGFYSFRARHAQVLSDKFAFKVTGEYTTGTEFEWADSVFIDRVGAFDDDGNPIPDGQAEGYEELELDPGIDFTRAEASLIYSPTTSLDVTFNTGYSNSNYLSATNVGRNQIVDWSIFYTQLKVNSDNWFAQLYYTSSNTDDTYAIDERTKQYYRGIDAGLTDDVARGDFSYQSGALFKDASKRWNGEFQYNNTFGNLDLIAGFQWQQDRANSQNTYLLEQEAIDFFKNDHIVLNQYGGYVHLTQNFGGGWKALAAARLDYHDVYEFNFVPKFGLLHVGEQGTWRLTYGQGIAAPTILNMFGNLFNGLILGNSDGFTLIDGTVVPKQAVEKIQTIELGYRGQVVPGKLFLDANAYYNISKDFLSPLTVLGVATLRGDTPVEDVQSGFAFYNGLVASYINFGQVNTYGFDLGLNYYFSNELSLNFNYSFFDWSVDEEDPENDFNGDGTVNFLDILVNSPNHKFGIGLNYSGEKFFGAIFGRWVQEYNYFSSFQIASETLVDDNGQPILYRGKPIVEDARSADTYNYGPLGGFFPVDLSVGYRVSDVFTISAAANNLFNSELREFTAVAPTRGLYTLEFRLNLPAIGKK